jgi:hypothetical protein
LAKVGLVLELMLDEHEKVGALSSRFPVPLLSQSPRFLRS